MISTSDIKFGIVMPYDAYRTFAPQFVKLLVEMGISERNIDIEHVPSVQQIPLGTHFMAEYTEVDCVMAIIADSKLCGEARKQLLELQMQWNMPIGWLHGTFSTETFMASALELITMVQLQSRMAGDVPQERGPILPHRKESIN